MLTLPGPVAAALRGVPAGLGTIRYGPGMRSQDYGGDVLAAGRRRRPQIPQVEAEFGLVVEDLEGRFCGAVVGCDKGAVTLEDRHGKRRVFPLNPAAFLLEGAPGDVVRPAAARPPAPARPTRTASGSVAAPQARARVARASRIYVEGRHDAELVEKIWGERTCATWAWWSNTWRASTTCQRFWPYPRRARPAPGRAGRPPGAGVQREPDRGRADPA